MSAPQVTSLRGQDFIKGFEAFRAQPYLCPAGVPTIGYGTTRYPTGLPVTLKDRAITEPEASDLLRHDLRRFEQAVRGLVKTPLDQAQFDALVSFTYNLGEEALRGSSLLRLLNQGDLKGTMAEWPKWNRIKDPKTRQLIVSMGLSQRRGAELRLFQEGGVHAE